MVTDENECSGRDFHILRLGRVDKGAEPALIFEPGSLDRKSKMIGRTTPPEHVFMEKRFVFKGSVGECIAMGVYVAIIS